MRTHLKFKSNSLDFPFKRFASSLVIVMVASVLLVFVVLLGKDIIISEWNKYKNNQNNKVIFESKKEVLSNVSSQVFNKSELVAIAMPDKNPVLWVISQLKNYLSENSNVLIKSLAVDIGEKNLTDINTLLVRIEIEAKDISGVLSMIDYLQKVLPITKVSDVSTEIGDLNVKSKVIILVYWSEYPTKLTNITESISSINQDEMEILNFVAQLKPPVFKVLSPSVPSIRENPFN